MSERPARLVWATPNADALVAEMARVSNPENERNVATAPRLIAYLIRNKHWSPFEMVNVCVEITTTRDIGRQLLRHRSLTFQEFSQRYADVGALSKAPLRAARLQDPNNRQNSIPTEAGGLTMWWEEAQQIVLRTAESHYKAALALGIAKEVARAILPEGLTPTRMYANGTVRSWLHFCDLRRGHGTQAEATAIAETVWGILRQACPMIVEAWETTR